MSEAPRQVTDSNAALGRMVESMAPIKASSNKVAIVIETIEAMASSCPDCPATRVRKSLEDQGEPV